MYFYSDSFSRIPTKNVSVFHYLGLFLHTLINEMGKNGVLIRLKCNLFWLGYDINVHTADAMSQRMRQPCELDN